MSRLLIAAATLPLILGGLAGCARQGEIMEGGVLTAYSACPPAAIPAPAGDITLFNPPTSRDATAIDVVATISNVRSSCGERGGQLITTAQFEVFGLRRDNRGARQVVLPYFASVVQGGQNVVAKRTGRVALNFADGQFRATAAASTAQSQVLSSAATLPANVRQQITARRRPGDPNAALDPLSDPAVRAAVEQARYELLVGFELTLDQLRYNATR